MGKELDFRGAFSVMSKEICEAAADHLNQQREAQEGGKGGPNLQGSGGLDFNLTADASGKAASSTSQYGAGATISCVARVTLPEGPTTYSGSVSSSDGGGTEFHNIKAGQPISFTLATSFWHSTTFSVVVSSSPPLPAGTAVTVHLDYTY